MNIKLGLVAERHDLPVDDFIFADGDVTFPINMDHLYHLVAKKFDLLGLTPASSHHITVYVTGLTPCTTAVIRCCFKNHHFLTLKHFDRDSGGYIDDVIFGDNDDVSFACGMPRWN